MLSSSRSSSIESGGSISGDLDGGSYAQELPFFPAAASPFMTTGGRDSERSPWVNGLPAEETAGERRWLGGRPLQANKVVVFCGRNSTSSCVCVTFLFYVVGYVAQGSCVRNTGRVDLCIVRHTHV